MGIVGFRAQIPAHLLRARRADRVSRHHRDPRHADRYLPADQHPGGDGDLELHRASARRRWSSGSRTYSQYSISSNVNGIKDMESQTLNGISVQKIYFQPDVNLDLAIAQIVSATNAIRALMPPGIQPPIIVQFNASSVPVLQLSLTSDSLNEQQLYDYGIYRLRQQLAPVPRRDLSDAGRRQIPADHGRYRPGQAARRGLTPARRGQRRQRAEPDAAVRPGQDRRHAIHRAHQRHARHDRRAQQHPDQIHQRRDGLHQGRRPGARRLGRAAEHRARRTASAPCC